jgi:hypothetical protein
MRLLYGGFMAVLLLGCDSETSDPVQPPLEGSGAAGPASSAVTASADVTTATIGETRGFFTAGAHRVVTLGPDFREITKLELPPGAYIANVSASFAASGSLVRLIDCFFTVGGVQRGELTRGMIGGIGPNNFTMLPHTVGVTLATRTDLGVACRTDAAGTGVTSQPSHLTAIRVDRLTARP